MKGPKEQNKPNLKDSISRILGKEIPAGRDTVFVKYKIPLMNMRKTKGGRTGGRVTPREGKTGEARRKKPQPDEGRPPT